MTNQESTAPYRKLLIESLNKLPEYIESLMRLKLWIDKILKVRQLLEEAVNELQDKPLVHLKNEYPTLFNIILAGLREDLDQPFEPLSISRFYYDVYGFGLEEEDARYIIRLIQGGITPDRDEFSSKVNISRLLRNTQVLNVMKYMRENLEEIIPRILDCELGIKGVKTIYRNLMIEIDKAFNEFCGKDFRKDPGKIECGVKVLSEFLNIAVSLLPLYNDLSRIFVSLSENLDVMLELYYGQDVWEVIKELFNKMACVNINVLEKLCWSKVLKGFKRCTLRGVDELKPFNAIVNVIFLIYELIQAEQYALTKYFEGLEDEFNKYLRILYEALKAKHPIEIETVKGCTRPHYNKKMYEYEYGYEHSIRLRLSNSDPVYVCEIDCNILNDTKSDRAYTALNYLALMMMHGLATLNTYYVCYYRTICIET